MIRAAVLAGLVLASGLAIARQDAVPEAARADLLSSQRDPADPAVRALPIRCKQGDLERARGRTLGDLFGDAWPQAANAAAAHRTSARADRLARVKWPAGLYTDRAVTIVAVLVDPRGAPLQAHVICATTQGFDAAVERASMHSAFRPATVDGAPVTGVAMVAWTFDMHERGR